MRILQRGDTGSDVKLLQTALLRAGYDVEQINGVFGSQTERAVKQFQRALGLKEDGIVGSSTWGFLEPFLEEPDPDILRRGSRGESVEILQNALKNAGYDPGSLDGLFGTKTQSALKAFQKTKNLPETGIADTNTWLALAPNIDEKAVLLKRGDSGIFVLILQTALKNAGFDPGTSDGVFGMKTQSALKAFQKANRLTVDGIAGPRTWKALKTGGGGGTGNVVMYTVKQGDTLSSIAKNFKTTVEELLKLNPRRNPDLIYVGEILKIPMPDIATRFEEYEQIER
ncbi:MAG: peptidoglycan-binding protein [Clostridia bacterium]